MFRFYLPLFLKLFMVLLCVLFKSNILSSFEYSRMRDVRVRLKTTGAEIKIARREGLLTINKIDIIR